MKRSPDGKGLDLATRAIHAGQSADPSTGAIMTPICQISTHVQASSGMHSGYDRQARLPFTAGTSTG